MLFQPNIRFLLNLLLEVHSCTQCVGHSGSETPNPIHLNNKEAKRELDVYNNTRGWNFQPTTTYFGVKHDRTLSYQRNLAGLRDKVMA